MGWTLSSSFPLLFLTAVLRHHFTAALPLSTNSRWIVNAGEGGERVKLSCVNWEVVASLDRNNVMMILDNQISKPGWCCSDFDGNGFLVTDTLTRMCGLKASPKLPPCSATQQMWLV
ncbi:hypothetical protein E3N88_44424 [Mikania micrantha]|uniref:Uncharacterized protein n=1 Tax=Mikania micrantha TaxID=192012 RepID=A0A5N6LC24_9ASTR|nr:hypothetical protein E3N88_44424 [Mikania micrantha]